MCLAIPGKIKSIQEEWAEVDFMGASRRVNISLIDSQLGIGDYILVHAGFAIQKVSVDDALSSIRRYEEISKSIK